MDVGAALRDAREQRGLSLDQVAHATKITVTILRAIENNRIDKLPGGIFTRGFVKAYAREVGLDPAETATRYVSQFEVAAESPPVEAAQRSLPSVVAEREFPWPDWQTEQWRAVATVGALLLVVAGGYYALRHRDEPAVAAATGADGAPATSAERATVPKETATGGSVEHLPRTREDADALKLDLEARGLCWVAATADGRRVLYRLMQKGERNSIDANGAVVLRVGNPATLTYSINGSTGRSLGRGGAPVTVRITLKNYRDFVAQ